MKALGGIAAVLVCVIALLFLGIIIGFLWDVMMTVWHEDLP